MMIPGPLARRALPAGAAVSLVLAAWTGSWAAVIPSRSCLECHGEPSLAKDLPGGKTLSLFVDTKAAETSVHRGLSCVECHRDITASPHTAAPGAVSCAACHTASEEAYRKSAHGKGLAQGDPDSPSCSTCHGTHAILRAKNPASKVYPLNLQTTCLSCHTDEGLEKRHTLPAPGTISAYEKSVHGRAVRAGMNVSAVCSDCHGSHTILPADAPASPINKKNIPDLCGKCHGSIRDAYRGSIHGQGLARGIADAPACTDCHGEHTITGVTDPESKVYGTNIVKTCGTCHDDAILQTQYGLPPKRSSTYYYSFHGIASTYGQVAVANCASCHGVHNILPSRDPRSTIAPANLTGTCGKCHPKAGENFSKGRIHIEAKKDSSMGVFVVRTFYTWFISILGAGFILHVLLDIIGWLKKRGGAR